MIIYSCFATTIQLLQQFNEFYIVQLKKWEQFSDIVLVLIKWDFDYF